MARILGAAPQDDFDRFRRGGTADRWLAVFQTGASQSFNLRCGSKVLAAGLPGKSVATWIFTPDGAMLDGSVKTADAPEKVIYEMPVWDLEPVELFFEEPAKAGTEIRWKVKVRNVGTAPTPEQATVAIDILLDNPLVDVYVQKKIDDAQDVVEAAITATRTVLRRLEAM